VSLQDSRLPRRHEFVTIGEVWSERRPKTCRTAPAGESKAVLNRDSACSDFDFGNCRKKAYAKAIARWPTAPIPRIAVNNFGRG
jgi:hypothetical protein